MAMRDWSGKQSDDGPLLPVQRAFVVQLKRTADPNAGELTGRVEHVRSGAATFFDSADGLLTFISRVVAPETSE